MGGKGFSFSSPCCLKSSCNCWSSCSLVGVRGRCNSGCHFLRKMEQGIEGLDLVLDFVALLGFFPPDLTHARGKHTSVMLWLLFFLDSLSFRPTQYLPALLLHILTSPTHRFFLVYIFYNPFKPFIDLELK